MNNVVNGSRVSNLVFGLIFGTVMVIEMVVLVMYSGFYSWGTGIGFFVAMTSAGLMTVGVNLVMVCDNDSDTVNSNKKHLGYLLGGLVLIVVGCVLFVKYEERMHNYVNDRVTVGALHDQPQVIREALPTSALSATDYEAVRILIDDDATSKPANDGKMATVYVVEEITDQDILDGSEPLILRNKGTKHQIYFVGDDGVVSKFSR